MREKKPSLPNVFPSFITQMRGGAAVSERNLFKKAATKKQYPLIGGFL